jgi:Rad3-related DNA helicase
MIPIMEGYGILYHAGQSGCKRGIICNMNNLIMKFPEGFSPRDKQAQAINAIEKAFDNGKKVVIVHADTGVGKTHLAKTLGNASRDVPAEYERIVKNYSIYGDDGADLASEFEPFGCYALTITKSLQDQYQTTFDDTGVLKGKGNYQCDIDDSLSVDVAPCIYIAYQKNDCWKANRCPYYNSRNNMLTSKFSALNYSMFFSLPNHLKKRQIMVCDEGSELEEQLVSQFTCEVDIPFLMRTQTLVTPFPNDDKNKPKALAWVDNLAINVEKSCQSYKDWFANNTSKKDIITFNKKKQEYTKLTNLQSSLALLLETFYDSDYIIERVENGIRFIPLKVDVLSKYLFNYAEKIVILSATIIDPAAYCKSLGITDYEYIHVGTDFEPEKSPIHIMAKQKLNYTNLKSMLPTLMTQIKGIMEHHKEDKGIIHTHTQYLADYIRENIRSNRLLCREAGVNNEQLLLMHEESDEPTVLVSPSMTYGVDLKGDLSRFQIILKAPWMPIKHVGVERLMKIDKEWYGNAMLKTLVQACGRSVRSKDDYCETYILDGSIFDAIDRNKKKLPKFFLDRFN